MSFFDRLANLWKGFLSLWISDAEARNPEAVYESAIEERKKKYLELKKAVSGIVYLRNKLQTELEQKEAELTEVNAQIPIAVEEGEDEAALHLIARKDELDAQIIGVRAELDKISGQAEEAKSGLITFQGEIEKLKREKAEMLAKKATAEARIQINETLEGMSADADIKALDSVRESIHKLQAEADVSSEVKSSSLDDKLAKIKAKTGNAAARSKLEELKRASAAKKAEADAVKKTI